MQSRDQNLNLQYKNGHYILSRVAKRWTFFQNISKTLQNDRKLSENVLFFFLFPELLTLQQSFWDVTCLRCSSLDKKAPDIKRLSSLLRSSLRRPVRWGRRPSREDSVTLLPGRAKLSKRGPRWSPTSWSICLDRLDPSRWLMTRPQRGRLASARIKSSEDVETGNLKVTFFCG